MIHLYNPNKVKADSYKVRYFTACGRVEGFWNPRQGYKSVLETTRSKEEVECQNCKNTKLYGN